MKKLFVLIALFAFANLKSQELKIIHINAKWNYKNNYKHIDDLKGVAKQYGYLSEQPPSIKQSIKSVPTIILIKNGRTVYVWSADISLKIKATPEEIQSVIDREKIINRRKSTE